MQVLLVKPTAVNIMKTKLQILSSENLELPLLQFSSNNYLNDSPV